MRFILSSAGALMLATAGCTQSGTAERGALLGAGGGAAAGAVAGEVIGDSPGKGAAVGAALGGVAGAAAGCAKAKDCFGRAQEHGDRRYDEFADRYYYVDPETGDTYWENGEFRSYGRGRP